MKKITGPNPLVNQSRGHRPVRSFVLREGRLTRGQLRAIETLWPTFGIENSSDPIDFDALFDRSAPRHLEIGFGMGESLAWSASNAPQEDFIGIEVHRPGVGSLLRQIGEQQINNVRIVCADAVEVLRERIPAESLTSVRLYFPDPWPKKRHHKRRIVQTNFVEEVARVLRPGGVFHLATDWQAYAEHMLEVVGNCAALSNLAQDQGYSERPNWRQQTKFEKRGMKLGHGVWDLLFCKQAKPSE